MFNWKKHCFIWLSLLSFPLLSTFIQQPVDAYTVTSPATEPPGGKSVSNWDVEQPIQRGYLRETPQSLEESVAWMVWQLDGCEDALLTYGVELGQGVSYHCDNIQTPGGHPMPESYGDLSTLPSAPIVLAVGGWYSTEMDEKFRFLTIDLADFTNLQAVGRNAFENLGNQQEVATVTEITVPDKCSQIEEDAWKDCKFLKKVTFLCPNITYLTPLAFDGCYDTLEEVRIVADENITEEGLKRYIVNLKSAGQQAILPDNPKDWTESDRNRIKNTVPVNTVTDFVATFEGHGFSWTIEEEEDSGQRFIVLRKSSPMPPPSIDIAEKENVLIDKQVYSSHDQSILTKDLRVIAPDGTELPNTDYDIYLRWVKDEETSEWVKYVDKDSLKVRDAGTYTIQYVIDYKGDNENLKSNPEGLNVTDDESGINVTINGVEV